MLQSPTQELAGGSERLTVGVAARLSRYLQVLTQAKKMGKDRISSQEISDYTNINATRSDETCPRSENSVSESNTAMAKKFLCDMSSAPSF